MNVTTDVQQQQRRQKRKRYKTLFGSALGYAAEGLDMLLYIFRTCLYFKRVSLKSC